jgi:hypothetical protein
LENVFCAITNSPSPENENRYFQDGTLLLKTQPLFKILVFYLSGAGNM